ncbi:MAG TPA: glycosyltransferase family 9 protein [Rhodocyclaceae bacterium]|nr:glycosyltransferase family 9 protein [Rhodocyclaceae bacterium]
MSAFRRVAEFLSGAAQPANMPRPGKVLFIQLAEGGSMILAAPAIQLALQRGVEVWFVTFQENAPALALTGLIPPERVFIVRHERSGRMAVDVVRLLRWLRRQRFDAVVDLELFARLTAALSFVSGAARRIGFAADRVVYRGRLMTHGVAFAPGRHMSRNYLQLVRALFDGTAAIDFSQDQALPRLQKIRPDAAANRQVAELLATCGQVADTRLVLVNANASDRLVQRRWPLDRFARLIEQVLAIRPDVSVLLIGGASDLATNQALLRAVGHYAGRRCFDIAGQLPIEGLPALFARSAVLVSNDSGPAHFAAVSEIPVVVLFGPETPVLFAPLGAARIISANLPCSPCVSVYNQRRSACQNNLCMQQIGVARVLDATLQTLSATSPNPLRPLARTTSE